MLTSLVRERIVNRGAYARYQHPIVYGATHCREREMMNLSKPSRGSGCGLWIGVS